MKLYKMPKIIQTILNFMSLIMLDNETIGSLGHDPVMA